MGIIKWFKNKIIQDEAENELVNTIIKSMREEPEKWHIDEYNARFGVLKIWITNSPYADMTLNGRRLPRRGELRQALAYCIMAQANKEIQK